MCRIEEIGFENFLFKPKRIISKFYILLNDIKNVISNVGTRFVTTHERRWARMQRAPTI